MTVRFAATALIAFIVGGGLLIPPDALAQAPGQPRFVGDPGLRSGNTSIVLPSVQPVAANSQARSNKLKSLTYPVRPLRDGDKVKLANGTQTDMLSPVQFGDFHKRSLDKDEMHRQPPQNKLLIVDTAQWAKLSPAERAKKTVYRTVTKTRKFEVCEPVYETRSCITYPCCCYEKLTFKVGTVTRQKTETITEKEPAGADYPTKDVFVDRDLFTKNAGPYYRTRLPQKIRGDDGRPYFFIPLKTDVRDELTASGGSTTTANEGIAQTRTGGQSSTHRDWVDWTGDAAGNWHDWWRYEDQNRTFTTSDYTYSTYQGTEVVREPVKTKEPLADPDRGLSAGPLDDKGRDMGVNSHGGDAADILGNTVLAPMKDGSFAYQCDK